MTTLEAVALVGLALNGLATLGSYVALRVQLEHRLTALETRMAILVVNRFGLGSPDNRDDPEKPPCGDASRPPGGARAPGPG